MKRILIVSTVSKQFYLFEQSNIEVLKSLGYEVHAAANFSDSNERLDALDIIRHSFDIQRSPFSIRNIKAYRQLKNIMRLENFDAVHCHSPMGGVLARLAAKATKISPVIYTAHGFHFFEGAPIINWLLYYPVEKWLSKITDTIITINKEDYNRAQNFKATEIVYVPGIGIDTKKFRSNFVNNNTKRLLLGVSQDAFIILSVGELNKNKNHEVIINAIAQIDNLNIYYVICGQGERLEYLQRLSKRLNVENRVIFLGFRNDINEIYEIADVFVFPSFREGLSVSLMEAMTAGLPVICSDIRGNQDLIENEKGGYLLNPNDINGFSKYIKILRDDLLMRKRMGKQNQIEIEKFNNLTVRKYMEKVYGSIL